MASERLDQRDERWFEELYRTHHAAVLAYARRRVDDADDVVSEVFGAAWHARAAVPDEPLAWLLRTASNHTLHAKRSFSRRARLWARAIGQAEPSPDHADAVAGRQDARMLVRHALARLAPGDQEILRLVAWEELTTEQLAGVLDCSSGSARVRLHRARRRLEKVLDDLQIGAEAGTQRRSTIEEARP